METDTTPAQVDDPDESGYKEAEPLVATRTLENKKRDDAPEQMQAEETRQRNVPDECPYSLRKKITVPKTSFRRGGVM